MVKYIFGKINFILPDINLQLKSALTTKYIFYQSLLYIFYQSLLYNCTYIGADKSRLMCNHSNQHLRHQWRSQCISQLVQVGFNRFSPFSVPKWKKLAQLARSYFTLQISYKKKDFAAICFHFGTENFVEQLKTIHLHFTILA